MEKSIIKSIYNILRKWGGDDEIQLAERLGKEPKDITEQDVADYLSTQIDRARDEAKYGDRQIGRASCRERV